MRPLLTFLAVTFVSSLCFAPARAQDPEIRRQAVELMERATAASEPPTLPNLERIDTFRVLDAPTGPREGTFTRVVVQGTGRREETTFGDYHSLNVWTYANGQQAVVRTRQIAPPEVRMMMHITPIHLFWFDDEDVIHAIVDKAVGSRNAHCAEFDTIRGQKIENNEFCFDAVNNTLIFVKGGEETFENSDFFQFAGELLPGRIVYSFAGVRKMEVTQSVRELTDATPNVLEAPPNASIYTLCKTFRRPIGQSMPQPKPGRGGRNYDVVVRGMIEEDGRVHDAVVQQTELPDLGAEALQLITQWQFTPLICDGHPGRMESSFILHFMGR